MEDQETGNVCQIDTLIEATRLILEWFNEKIPCIENHRAIIHLGLAKIYLLMRKKNRPYKSVKGTNLP